MNPATKNETNKKTHAALCYDNSYQTQFELLSNSMSLWLQQAVSGSFLCAIHFMELNCTYKSFYIFLAFVSQLLFMSHSFTRFFHVTPFVSLLLLIMTHQSNACWGKNSTNVNVIGANDNFIFLTEDGQLYEEPIVNWDQTNEVLTVTSGGQRVANRWPELFKKTGSWNNCEEAVLIKDKVMVHVPIPGSDFHRYINLSLSQPGQVEEQELMPLKNAFHVASNCQNTSQAVTIFTNEVCLRDITLFINQKDKKGHKNRYEFA